MIVVICNALLNSRYPVFVSLHTAGEGPSRPFPLF